MAQTATNNRLLIKQLDDKIREAELIVKMAKVPGSSDTVKECHMIYKSKLLLKSMKNCTSSMSHIRSKLKILNGYLAMMQKRVHQRGSNIRKLIEGSLGSIQEKSSGETSPLSVLYHSRRKCLICYKTKSESKFLYSNNCPHIFCGKCIAKNILESDVSMDISRENGRKCMECRTIRGDAMRIIKVGSCYQMTTYDDLCLTELYDEHEFDTSDSEVDEDDVADDKEIMNSISESAITSITDEIMEENDVVTARAIMNSDDVESLIEDE